MMEWYYDGLRERLWVIKIQRRIYQIYQYFAPKCKRIKCNIYIINRKILTRTNIKIYLNSDIKILNLFFIYPYTS